MAPTLTETEAKREILYLEVEKRFLDAGAKENKLVPTDEEVEPYMATYLSLSEARTVAASLQ